jgi:hypothetical protein
MDHPIGRIDVGVASGLVLAAADLQQRDRAAMEWRKTCDAALAI